MEVVAKLRSMTIILFIALHDAILFDAFCLQSGPPTGGGGGGATGAFFPGPQPERGPLNTCLKDRYTLIEQSDLNTLIEQSQYSSEEQCSKFIDKEIWLVRGSYCHC